MSAIAAAQFDEIDAPIPSSWDGGPLIPLCLSSSGMHDYAFDHRDSSARLVCDRLLSGGDEYFHLQNYEKFRDYLAARMRMMSLDYGL
jgi:hypothetical protein